MTPSKDSSRRRGARTLETRVRYTSAVGAIPFERSLVVSKNGEWVEGCAAGRSSKPTTNSTRLHRSVWPVISRKKVVTAGIVDGGMGGSTMWT